MWPIEKLMRHPDLPVRTVTREEFVRILTARGESLSKAELQAKWCISLVSEMLVGAEYLRIEME